MRFPIFMGESKHCRVRFTSTVTDVLSSRFQVLSATAIWNAISRKPWNRRFRPPPPVSRAKRHNRKTFFNTNTPSSAGSNRGDTFIVQGKIYPGGTIPKGNGVFSPDNSGSIGTWICRGTWMVNSSELAVGASPAFDTTQIYLLPDESKQLFSEGL